VSRVRFQPPFAAGAGQFHGVTYPGHTPYAVDWNRGYGWTDEGDIALCSLAGRVVAIEAAFGGVKLEHPYGYSTWYFHLRDITVRVGELVRTGQALGLISNTYPKPRILSPHLHYEQHRYGSPIRVSFDAIYYPGSMERVDHVLYGPLITGQ
jgi:murein DD-endopeptidase MepM/ murein hydrolase activator NlpD